MNEQPAEEQIDIENLEHQIQLFGNFDENIRIIEKHFSVQIIARDDMIKIIGNEKEVKVVRSIIQQLLESIKKNNPITTQSVEYIITLAKKGEVDKFSTLSEVICHTAKGKAI